MADLPLVLSVPHRALFLTGVINLALSLLWWTGVLANFAGVGAAPLMVAGDLPYLQLHAPIMLYAVLLPLFLGFLLTVFPRWAGYSDLKPWQFVPVVMALMLSSAVLWWGTLSANAGAVRVAFAGIALALAIAFVILAGIPLRERQDRKPVTWHLWSCLLALAFGLLALGLLVANASVDAVRVSNRMGLLLFAVPVFFTVCHRMLPFFAGNVVQDYVRWRPSWILAVFWLASGILTYGNLRFDAAWTQIGAAVLCALTALMLYRWWPRSRAPGIFWVLMIAFAWLPVACLLELLSSSIGFHPRGADHALTIGFFCSMIVAMVTRVSQGHSGRPLRMPWAAWLAFGLVQVAACSRLHAAIQGEAFTWLLISAAVLALGLLPWIGRSAYIYVTRRADGKPG